ncbi:MAG: hypothetical protein JKY61_09545 [Planctomycetes bacterium]|nr:hypothetical protein [Planctomycetota bacterium]
MENLAGVQDVFCGSETVIHMKKGAGVPAPGAIEKVFTSFKIVCNGIERDDSALL